MRASEIHVFKGHLHSVGAIAMSKKSLKFLITGSADKTIKKWKIQDSQVSYIYFDNFLYK